MTWIIPTLNVGASQILQLVVDVDNPAPAGITDFVNTAFVTHDDIDPTPADDSDTDTDLLDGNPDLEVIKTLVTGSSHNAGDPVQYTLSVTNLGNQNASGVVLTDLFPDPPLDFISVDADVALTPVTPNEGGHVFTGFAGNILTWDLGEVVVGETVTVTVNAMVKNPIPATFVDFTNTAMVTDDGTGNPDADLLNNTDAETGLLPGVPDLVVSKHDGLTVINAGDTATYTITVSNIGQQNATGVDIVDTLPDDVAFVSADGGVFMML